MEHTILTTARGEALTGTPWDIYPRPQLRRNSFLCLNGQWDFAMGKEEGIIGPGIDRYDAILAVEGAFFSYILPPAGLSPQEQADRTVAMLLKSLA